MQGLHAQLPRVSRRAQLQTKAQSIKEGKLAAPFVQRVQKVSDLIAATFSSSSQAQAQGRFTKV